MIGKMVRVRADTTSGRSWDPALAGFVRHVTVLGLFFVLTAFMVSPLVADPRGLTAGWEGDNTFCIRQFWWMKRAIVDLGISPFFDPGTYYPVGHRTPNGELFPATTVLGIPVTALWGSVVAYNVTLLFTFVMTGFGTYLWISRLSGSGGAGIVAGVVAAFLPFRFAHLAGHLHIVSTHWVPLTLYAFDRFLERKHPVRAVGLGVCFGLVALSSWYYAYSIVLMLPIYALVRSRPWREHWTADWWRGAAIAGATAAVMILPFVIPYLQIRAQGGLTRSLEEMEYWSLNFYDFFLPNRLNPAVADFVLRWFPEQGGVEWVERGVSLGYTAIALALTTFFARRRVPVVGGLLVVWLVSYLIALGPTLHSGDRPILLPLPLPLVALAAKAMAPFASLAPVRADVLAHQAVAIPMPSLFMFAFVPLTNGMRVMARFGMWTGIMTAGLAGLGTLLVLQAVRRRFGDRRLVEAVVVAALSGLVLFESHSQIVTMPLRPREVDVWLARQPEGAVVELPLAQALRPLQDYYKVVHAQPTIFGPIGDGFFPLLLEERRRVLAAFPSLEGISALRSWHTRYVLFTAAEVQGWPQLKQQLDAADGLTFEREIAGVHVYLVD